MGLYVHRREYDLSLNALQQARSLLGDLDSTDTDLVERAKKLNNTNSWNMGCTFLTHQLFEEGWKLYEYGLRTKAVGAQKWQRALPKPFTALNAPFKR